MDFLDLAVIFTCSTSGFHSASQLRAGLLIQCRPSGGRSPEVSAEETAAGLVEPMNVVQMLVLSPGSWGKPWFVHWTCGGDWFVDEEEQFLMNPGECLWSSMFSGLWSSVHEWGSLKGGNCGNWWCIKGPRMGWNQFCWQTIPSSKMTQSFWCCVRYV